MSAPTPAQQPTPTSQFSLSSILATSQRLLGLKGGPLTKRDAWAATFDNLVTTRSSPRTDCPKTLPSLPPPSMAELHRQLALPIDEHGYAVIKSLCDMVEGGDVGLPGREQQLDGDVSELVQGDVGGPYCAGLGICLPPARGARACGAGLRTQGEFSAWRQAMWARYMAQ